MRLPRIQASLSEVNDVFTPRRHVEFYEIMHLLMFSFVCPLTKLELTGNKSKHLGNKCRGG